MSFTQSKDTILKNPIQLLCSEIAQLIWWLSLEAILIPSLNSSNVETKLEKEKKKDGICPFKVGAHSFFVSSRE